MNNMNKLIAIILTAAMLAGDNCAAYALARGGSDTLRPPAFKLQGKGITRRDVIKAVGAAAFAGIAQKADAEMAISSDVERIDPQLYEALERVVPALKAFMTWPVESSDPSIQAAAQKAKEVFDSQKVKVIFTIADLKQAVAAQAQEAQDPEEKAYLEYIRDNAVPRAEAKQVSDDEYVIAFDIRTLKGGMAAMIVGLAHEIAGHMSITYYERKSLTPMEEEARAFDIEINYLRLLLADEKLLKAFGFNDPNIKPIKEEIEELVAQDEAVLLYIREKLAGEGTHTGQALSLGLAALGAAAGITAAGAVIAFMKLTQRKNAVREAEGKTDKHHKKKSKGPRPSKHGDDPSRSSSEAQDAFPDIPDGFEIRASQLREILTHKYLSRKILKGGPIAQPEFFVSLGPVYGFYAQFMDKDGVRSFDDLVRDVISGKIGQPLVFKNTLSALGVGVFFLRRTADGMIEISVFSKMDSAAPPAAMDIIIDESIRNVKGVKISRKNHVARILIDPTKCDALRVIRSVAEGMRGFAGSSMMAESRINAVLHNGRAYETRCTFAGSLRYPKCFLTHNGIKGKKQWIGKIGSSPEFANHTFREDEAALIAWGRGEIFDPLFKIFDIKAEEQEAFKAYVDETVREEYSYLVERLKASGIDADIKVRGEFDLMWLAPEEEGAFPKPVLIESTFALLNPDVGNKVITVKKPADVSRSSAEGELLAPYMGLFKDYFEFAHRMGGEYDYTFKAIPHPEKVLLQDVHKLPKTSTYFLDSMSRFFATNEMGWEKAFEYMPGRKGAYLGVSYGGQNLSYMVNGNFDQGIIIDFNPYVGEIFMPIRNAFILMARTRAEYLSFLTGVKFTDEELSELAKPGVTLEAIWNELAGRISSAQESGRSANKEALWAQVRKIFPERLLSPAQVFWDRWSYTDFKCSDMVREMMKQGSWLSSEENFQKVKSMVKEGRIMGVRGNWLDGRLFEKISQYLREKDIAVSAIYASNISEWFKYEGDRKRLHENLNKLPVAQEVVYIHNINASSTKVQVLKDKSASEGSISAGELGTPAETMASSAGVAERIGELVKAYNKDRRTRLIEKTRAGQAVFRRFEDALGFLKQESVSEGARVLLESDITSRQMRELTGLNFECFLFRLRGQKEWILYKGSSEFGPSMSVIKEFIDAEPAVFCDVWVHNHPNSDEPLPSAGDIFGSTLFGINGIYSQFIVGRSGVTQFKVTNASAADYFAQAVFHNKLAKVIRNKYRRNYVVEMFRKKFRKDYIRGLDEVISIVEGGDFYPEDHPLLKKVLEEVLAESGVDMQFKKWEELNGEELALRSDFSGLLQINDDLGRRKVIEFLWKIDPDGKTLTDIFRSFSHDRDESVQMAVLGLFYSHHKGDVNTEIIEAFTGSKFKNVAELAKKYLEHENASRTAKKQDVQLRQMQAIAQAA